MTKRKRTKREVPIEIPAVEPTAVPQKYEKVTPYDTGKVKIGCAYVPPIRPISEDEHVWQDVFLHNDKMHSPFRTLAIWAACIVGLTIYAIILVGV